MSGIEEGSQRNYIRKIEAKPIDEILNFGPEDEELEMYGSEEDWNVELEVEPTLLEEKLDYAPFDAQVELRHVRQLSPSQQMLPREERVRIQRERLSRFKQELMNQKEAIAQAIQFLRQSVESEPNIPGETFKSDIRRFYAARYGFTSRQLSYFDNAIDHYEEKHTAVEKIRTLHTSDSELFQAVFNRAPIGKVEVIKGPMTLYFRCFSDVDYVFIYHWEKYKDTSDAPTISDIEQACLSIGFAKANGCAIDELRGTITAERATDRDSRSSIDTRTHEDQHQFNKLFTPIDRLLNESRILERVAERAHTPQEAIDMMIRVLVRRERTSLFSSGIDDAARDEILAQYKGGAIATEILLTMRIHTLYDYKEKPYYSNFIAQIPKRVVEHLKDEVSDVMYQDINGELQLVDANALEISETNVVPYIHAVFGEEYQTDLGRWINAITTLEQQGRDRNEIIAMLSQEPIHSWPNLVRHLEQTN